MKITSAKPIPPSAGRPRTSNLTRPEQLRLAKQLQRKREACAGQTEARLILPREVAKRLMFASRQSDFLEALSQMLDSETIELNRYPQLKLLCWNRVDPFLSAKDAWNLYERNWRFIEADRLTPMEQRLIEMLSARFGPGELHG